jgi:hypothetical protein
MAGAGTGGAARGQIGNYHVGSGEKRAAGTGGAARAQIGNYHMGAAGWGTLQRCAHDALAVVAFLLDFAADQARGFLTADAVA